MEARSVVVVDGVEELSEELSSVVLVVVGGVVALLAEDWGTNRGPVSKNPQRSLMFSKVQSSAVIEVQVRAGARCRSQPLSRECERRRRGDNGGHWRTDGTGLTWGPTVLTRPERT